ncbi:MAG: hypothetical protein ABI969_10935 [bacterium]
MSARVNEIALSGAPRNVTGMVPYSVARSAIVPMSINVRGESTVYRAVVRPIGTATSEIRLRLPVDTPPGIYTGESMIDGEPRRVMVKVDAVLRISVVPKQTRVTTAAKSTVEFGLTVMNGGNVAFDVPKSDAFDLDDAVGQERALGKTLRAPLAPGEHRIDRFFDELRESHGGEAQVSVRSGAGPLQPGESRELSCTLAVPATAREGRSYSGPWTLGNTAHVIVADIKTSGRPRNGTPKAETRV